MNEDIITRFHQVLDAITPITKDEFQRTTKVLEHRKLPKGEHFVTAGDTCREIAFIGKGLLRTYYSNEQGEEVTLCFCTENRFTTSFKSFIARVPSSLAIEAMEPSEILVLQYDSLQLLYKETISWPTIGRLMAEREYLNMESYALTLNRETAKEKYLRLLREQPQVVHRAPIQQIASYLGVTRETLSRIRSQLTHEVVL